MGFQAWFENGFKNKERLQELIDYPGLIGRDEIIKTIESKGLLEDEDGEDIRELSDLTNNAE